jgi:photosystem II stability/assembly factor-like uncharacterized protein
MISSCNFLSGAEFYVAIDNKGLWPILTKLPDGTLGASIYNHPSHGRGNGSNTELWISENSGRNWKYRSQISSQPPDNPEAVRMNMAIGVNIKGEIIAIISGFQAGLEMPLLPLQLSVSDDSGKTWKRECILGYDMIPFGNILAFPDGELLCSMYSFKNDSKSCICHILSSSDHGRTWKLRSEIPHVNETHLLLCSNGDILAAARSECVNKLDNALPHGDGTILYRSKDLGKTWDNGTFISPQGQENANLVEMESGKLACFITSRIPGLFGVVYRVSEDGGQTWGNFETLISISANDWQKTDGGYPSCVRFDDGTLVIAYYFGPACHGRASCGKSENAQYTTPWHQRYHMGVCICNDKML